MSNEKQRAILDAALDVFTTNGFANAKISDIAEKAGVGKGTVYLYFSSKEDLFASLLLSHQERLEQEVSIAVSKGSTAIEQLQLFISKQLEFMIGHNGKIVSLVINLMSSSDAPHKSLIFQKMKGRPPMFLAVKLQEIIERGQSEGTMKPIDARVASNCVIGGIMSLTRWASVRGCDIDVEDLSSQVLKFYCKGICQ